MQKSQSHVLLDMENYENQRVKNLLICLQKLTHVKLILVLILIIAVQIVIITIIAIKPCPPDPLPPNTTTTTTTTSPISSGVLQFTVGNYILFPYDYSYATHIVVEMWGGGGAGNSYNGHGGASGGYVKVIIPTRQQVFNITVGRGGTPTTASIKCQQDQQSGTLFPFSCCSVPNDGENTVFQSSDVELVAGGGRWGKIIPCDGAVIRPLVGTNSLSFAAGSKVLYNLSGNNETFTGYNSITPCQRGMVVPMPESTQYFGYNGGAAPFSTNYGVGMFTLSLDEDYPSVRPAQDGGFPGGGGGGSGLNYESWTQLNSSPCVSVGDQAGAAGGHGLVNVYY